MSLAGHFNRFTRIKICCIQNLAEAEMAIRYGADALGLVAAMPSGPGPIPEEEITRIAAHVPPGVAAVLLTSRTDPDEIIDQQQRTGVNSLQLCARLTPDDHKTLRAALPGVRLMQVVHVTGEDSYREALEVAPNVHALLLDTGAPEADVPVLGGTGRTHDWSISRRIVQDCGRPVYLAGGLNADNVAEAIEKVKPFGVDICNGVRIDMKLVESKLADYVRAVNETQDTLLRGAAE